MYSTNFSSDKVNPSFHLGGWSGKGRQSGDRCINTRRNGARPAMDEGMIRCKRPSICEMEKETEGSEGKENVGNELLANKLPELGDTFSHELALLESF